MNRLLFYISFFLIAYASQAQNNEEPVRMVIDCYLLDYFTIEEYCEYKNMTIDSLGKVTEIYFTAYYSDSIPISAEYFPNVETINFSQSYDGGNYAILGVKGISTFKNLKKLYIDFPQSDGAPHIAVATSNFFEISEIYECENLEELTLSTPYPITISSDIKKLKKLKNLSCQIANPEVLLNSPNWYSWKTGPADIMILCKILGKTENEFYKIYNEPYHPLSNQFYNYDFTVDSTVTLYYMNGDTLCSGRYNKDYTRVGTWKYYYGARTTEITYDDNGNVIEYSTFEPSRTIINKFDLKNNENYFKVDILTVYKYKNEKPDTLKYYSQLKFDRNNNIIYSIDSNSLNRMSILDLKNKLYYWQIINNDKEAISFSCYKFFNNGLCEFVYYDLTKASYNNFTNETFCYDRKRGRKAIRGWEHERMIQEKEFVSNSLYKFEDLENYFKTN